MKSKIIIGLCVILAIILCIIIISFGIIKSVWFSTPTASPTNSAMPTNTPPLIQTFTPTITFMVVCTPPRCAIGTSETYYCPGVCPGGCGTTCATYTPTP
jgi:hypothetical protein